MFRSQLYTSSSVVQIKKYCKYLNNKRFVDKNLYLTLFIGIKTNIMNKTIKILMLTIKNTVNI